MKTKSTLATALFAVSALLAACGSIRYVRRTQTGGTIALQGDRDDAMKKARGAMQEHCQGPYTIVEEGEVVVGEDTYANADTRQYRSGQSTQAASSTRAATEWRVTYVCGTQAPPPGYDPNQQYGYPQGNPQGGYPGGQQPGNY